MTIIFAISTHTPLARRDENAGIAFITMFAFLLTRLLRGVTEQISVGADPVVHFYSHASCEA